MRDFWEMWGGFVLAIGISLCLIVGLLGFCIHTQCTKDCKNSPAYYYNVPIFGTHYNSFYDTDGNGVPYHPSSSGEEDNPGSHESEPPPEPHFSEP